MSQPRHGRGTDSTRGSRVDPREPVNRLVLDLRSDVRGLGSREAARRLEVYGNNELPTSGKRNWPRALSRQFTHPLAVLLWIAAALAWFSGTGELATAIILVIVLNAALAFWQEEQAEHAVQTLGRYLPQHSHVRRGGEHMSVPVGELVPGDVLLIGEGERVPADARLLSGTLEVDASALTGESNPVERAADLTDTAERVLDSPVLVFSGTVCTRGHGEAIVHATGARTELGRIATLSARVRLAESPLERQVRRVAWLIAAVAGGVAAAFLPLGVLAGLSWAQSFLFAIGLLVANVPEGLLPTITLALAAGVRGMARKGALVKRLSAVETLGSTTVICTDKTGTLTRNAMRVVESRDGSGERAPPGTELLRALARCETADDATASGDPMELALLEFARAHDVRLTADTRNEQREKLYPFDPRLRRMASVEPRGEGFVVHVKGAPEEIIARCVTLFSGEGSVELTDTRRTELTGVVSDMADRGLRVIAFAVRGARTVPEQRDSAETGLCLLGLVGLIDPPRPEVTEAVHACHSAGIRVHIVTGDYGRTAAAVAREVGIRAERVLDGPELDELPEADLDRMLLSGEEIVFARASPESKLRIADALNQCGHVVAMTGDGINDAPALRRADLGVAMGVGGTDVAREAASVVLTDDNFATIVDGIEEGRRVYDNVGKFVLYIFAHLVPEVLPFLLFALSGGMVPLPLTVLQILAIDLGTETLPALALGRERAEPGLMREPPRERSRNVISGELLLRAWAIMGITSAVLVLLGYFLVLFDAGWSPGIDLTEAPGLRHAYAQATTTTFLGIVFCQLGTAFASRTRRAALRDIGSLTNRLLLAGFGFELLFAAAIVYVPPLQRVFDTAAPPAWVYVLLLPFPLIVWAADETYRGFLRRGHRSRVPIAT
ncbi:plasma-membrane calcium-translocating P-type ATPase [Actinopolyspora mzabensis]|uniref:Plasma-membrane calcium-translocating P-type ATPase n=1 Tax=Actinopolyspora mzabensis TaxID=995066 RepID=A0A1G9EKW7_ACTMZ|nr:cation-transporting P-type ATPase [Actinopolyspora mzabensis]SDK76691.1 plasma-membrane calcium-translocating P-type ATPase [Actinopolyspora mzabensis]